MKKTALALVLALLALAAVPAQEPATSIGSGNLVLSVPSKEEVSDYMYLYRNLLAVEEGKRRMDASLMSRLVEAYYGKDTLDGCLFDSWLLRLGREDVRNYAIDAISDLPGSDSDAFLAALERLYASRPEPKTGGRKGNVRRDCGGGLHDEGIDYFTESEASTFDGKLGLMLLSNDWTELTLKARAGGSGEAGDGATRDVAAPAGGEGRAPAQAEDGQLPADPPKRGRSFYLMNGGGTNALSISFEEYAMDETDFVSAIGAKARTVPGDKYPGWSFGELAVTGEFERSGADRIFVGLGEGPDSAIPGIEGTDIVVCLYSRALGKGFMVHYYVNISPANNCFEIRERLFRRVAQLALFVFLE